MRNITREIEEVSHEKVCFVASLCFFLLVINVSAEITFFADFWARSNEVIPDKSVNDPLNYIPENPFTVWTVGRFGRDVLGKGVLTMIEVPSRGIGML